MNGAEFEQVKTLIENKKPITKEQLKGLENLQKQYTITKTRCNENGDIKKALYYRQLALEVYNLIEQSQLETN